MGSLGLCCFSRFVPSFLLFLHLEPHFSDPPRPLIQGLAGSNPKCPLCLLGAELQLLLPRESIHPHLLGVMEQPCCSSWLQLVTQILNNPLGCSSTWSDFGFFSHCGCCSAGCSCQGKELCGSSLQLFAPGGVAPVLPEMCTLCWV